MPLTPGHEIAGVVGAIGSVTDSEVGDEVGVGALSIAAATAPLFPTI
jgi:D-arabinose 1-dehydrogenase-like Zn-dependent alcohol dehydrogenase